MADLITFADLEWQGWFVLGMVLLSFVCMIADFVTPDWIFFAEVIIFMQCNILTVSEALAGFASTGVWSPAVMFIVAEGLARVGGLDFIMGKVLGTPRDVSVGQIRMMLIALLASSWISDTAVTAIMIPIVIAYCQKARMPLKQLMIILGYSTLTGGTNTVVGTSTNLVISSMMDEWYGMPESPNYDPNYTSITIFGITPYGLPNSAWLVVFAVLLAPLFLTDGGGLRKWLNYCSKSAVLNQWTQHDAFNVPLTVQKGSPIVGMTVEESGIMDLRYIMPLRFRREGSDREEDVSSDVMIQAGDTYIVAGDLTKLSQMVLAFDMQPEGGQLVDQQDSHIGGNCLVNGAAVESKDVDAGVTSPCNDKDTDLFQDQLPTALNRVNIGPPQLFTARVSNSSSLIGRTASDASIVSETGALVLAVRRPTDPRKRRSAFSKLDDLSGVTLQAGDEVLLRVESSWWREEDSVRATLERAVRVRYNGQPQEFMMPVVIKGALGKSLMAGKTVADAGLKGVAGASLVAIQRAYGLMGAVMEEEELLLGDVLWFAGSCSAMVQLRKLPGLEVCNDEIEKIKDWSVSRMLIKVAVTAKSPLSGRTGESVNFTTKFQAAIVAVSRQGTRLVGPPNRVVLLPGDTLLLEAGPHFRTKTAPGNTCFDVVEALPNSTPPRFWLTVPALLITATCFGIYVANLRSIVPMMGACGLLLITIGCMTPTDARNAIDWKILMTIGWALAASQAMEKWGAAEALANVLISWGEKMGGASAMIGIIYITTMICSQILMNTPAASIIFPIAANIADEYGVDKYVMAYTIMIAASAVYTTPFGDNINLMTSGVGDYSVWEFVRYGIIVQVCMCVTAVIILACGSLGGQYIVTIWVVSGIALAVIVVGVHALALIETWRDRAALRHRLELRKLREEKLQKRNSAIMLSAGDIQYPL